VTCNLIEIFSQLVKRLGKKIFLTTGIIAGNDSV
jgi:hypothetical protein